MGGRGHGCPGTPSSCTQRGGGTSSVRLGGEEWGAGVRGCRWHRCGHGECWEPGVLCHPCPPPAPPPPAPSPFAPADGDAGGVEPTQKVLLSKPPLATAPRRREPLNRAAGKGPGHAPPRTRGQVPFLELCPPFSPSPHKTAQPLPGPSPRPSPHRCPAPAPHRGSGTSAPLERSPGSSRRPPARCSPTAAPGLGPQPWLGAAVAAGGSRVPPRVLPSPALRGPHLSRQHRPTAAPEIFEGSAEEEEFLQIKVVEGSWSPGGLRGAARGGHPGGGLWGTQAGREGAAGDREGAGWGGGLTLGPSSPLHRRQQRGCPGQCPRPPRRTLRSR